MVLKSHFGVESGEGRKLSFLLNHALLSFSLSHAFLSPSWRFFFPLKVSISTSSKVRAKDLLKE